MQNSSTADQLSSNDKLLACSTSTIANALLALGFRNRYLMGLNPLDPQQPRMLGKAYTLRFIPAREDLDNLEIYELDSNVHRRAIEEIPEGSVLVMDTGNCVAASSIGDIMATRLKKRGIAGFVTDGGCRDTPAIVAAGLPGYQRQSAPPSTVIALHAVDLEVPIGCAGVAVYPNDTVVGDREGVVVIPAHLVDDVADSAYATTDYEEFVEVQISQGRSIFGLFPSTENSRDEFQRWVAGGRPKN